MTKIFRTADCSGPSRIAPHTLGLFSASLMLTAGIVAGCGSDDPACVSNDPVTVCATSMSNGVRLTIDGLSSFSTGTISVPATDFTTRIAAGEDGRLPAKVSELLDVPSGSTVRVLLADGAETVDISVQASS